METASKERVHDLWGKFPKMGPPAWTTPDIILLSPHGSVSLDLLWSIPRGLQIPLGAPLPACPLPGLLLHRYPAEDGGYAL